MNDLNNRFYPVLSGSFLLCTPGMGVNLWGESPLYVNPVGAYSISRSISRKQGRNREGPSEGLEQSERRAPGESDHGERLHGVQNYEPTNRNSI